MNNEEIQALMTQLKDAGLTEEDIANGILWPMFRDGKISREDLATLCSALGLELAEDFDKDTEADPIDSGDNNGGDDKNPAENVTKEEAEEVYVKFKPNTETDMNKLLEWLFVNNITTKSYNRAIGIYPAEDKIFRISVDLTTNTITFGCFCGQRLTLPLEVIEAIAVDGIIYIKGIDKIETI